jgi:hypothetical protein
MPLLPPTSTPASRYIVTVNRHFRHFDAHDNSRACGPIGLLDHSVSKLPHSVAN